MTNIYDIKPDAVYRAASDVGRAIASNCLGIEMLPIVPGSPTHACPGWGDRVLDNEGEEVEAGEIENICVKMPLPPNTSPILWNADQRYRESYFKNFPGFYETGDAGIKDEHDYNHVMARTDDVINVAGRRFSRVACRKPWLPTQTSSSAW